LCKRHKKILRGSLKSPENQLEYLSARLHRLDKNFVMLYNQQDELSVNITIEVMKNEYKDRTGFCR
jgi:hypothetical protein